MVEDAILCGKLVAIGAVVASLWACGRREGQMVEDAILCGNLVAIRAVVASLGRVGAGSATGERRELSDREGPYFTAL